MTDSAGCCSAVSIDSALPSAIETMLNDSVSVASISTLPDKAHIDAKRRGVCLVIGPLFRICWDSAVRVNNVSLDAKDVQTVPQVRVRVLGANLGSNRRLVLRRVLRIRGFNRLRKPAKPRVPVAIAAFSSAPPPRSA